MAWCKMSLATLLASKPARDTSLGPPAQTLPAEQPAGVTMLTTEWHCSIPLKVLSQDAHPTWLPGGNPPAKCSHLHPPPGQVWVNQAILHVEGITLTRWRGVGACHCQWPDWVPGRGPALGYRSAHIYSRNCLTSKRPSSLNISIKQSLQNPV